MDDESVSKVVGGKGDGYPITHQNADLELFHLAADPSGNGGTTIQLDMVVASTGGYGHATFHLKQIVS